MTVLPENYWTLNYAGEEDLDDRSRERGNLAKLACTHFDCWSYSAGSGCDDCWDNVYNGGK